MQKLIDSIYMNHTQTGEYVNERNQKVGKIDREAFETLVKKIYIKMGEDEGFTAEGLYKDVILAMEKFGFFQGVRFAVQLMKEYKEI